jgi:histidyl-tRNA synthetase
MNNKYKPLRGFKYNTFLETEIFNFIKNEFVKLATKYNIKFINPPLLAKTSLFKSLGEASDVVNKELYAFTQKDGEEVCLIPECTRIFVEQMAYENIKNGAYGYISSCFRYERPQFGRYRSFNQIGLEFIGKENYMVDVEIFLFINNFLKNIYIEDYIIEINSIGTLEDRKNYQIVLKEYFMKIIDNMSNNSKNKFERGAYLRMLDSKDEEDKIYINNVPKITDYLSEESKNRFNKIKETLRKLNINFKENPLLVRGLDYYNDLVFEYTHEILGNQALSGGGRYDGLFKEITNEHIPAIGFGMGVERLIHILEKNPLFINKIINNKIYIYLLPVNETEYLEAIKIKEIISGINNKNYILEILYDKNLSNRLKEVNKKNGDYVVIFGENEVANKEVIIKNMKNNLSVNIKVDDLINYFN